MTRLKDALGVFVQASSHPFGRRETAVRFLHLFNLVIAVDLCEKNAAVVADDEQIWIDDARTYSPGLSPRLFIQHGQDLDQVKIWISISVGI